jgi:hypothetical protein
MSGGKNIEVYLTDKYPNISAFQNAKEKTDGQVTLYPGIVDAACLPGELPGFRTIFTSFHHFTPGEAVAILQNAVDEPFVRPFRIFEIILDLHHSGNSIGAFF